MISTAEEKALKRAVLAAENPITSGHGRKHNQVKNTDAAGQRRVRH
jgi:hypothetical protein